jgi:hypothetical protein
VSSNAHCRNFCIRGRRERLGAACAAVAVCLVRDSLAAAGDEYLSAQQTYKYMREKQKKIAYGERGAVFLCECLRKLITQLAAEQAASCKSDINYVILVLLLRLKNPINLTLLPHINLHLYGCTCFDLAL